MINEIVIKINKIDDVKILILSQYKTLKDFWIKNKSLLRFNYESLTLMMNNKYKKHSSIKRLCKLLKIDIEKIEEWKDL